MENNSDFKYQISSLSTISVGSRYSFAELLASRDTNFKFKTLIRLYILREVEAQTTLESYLYYLSPQDASYDAMDQINLKVKVMVPHKNAKGQLRYREQLMKIAQVAAVPPREKQRQGWIIREAELSKLGLMGLSL